MKKKLFSVVLWILIVCLAAPAALSETAMGQQGVFDQQGNYKLTCNVHSFGDWVVVEPATCQNTGIRHHTCTVCGYVERDIIPVADHSWSDWTVTKAPTCAATGTKTRTCSVCGASESQEIAKTDGHSWGDWVVTKEATCAENGTQKRTCAVCGKEETKAISSNDAHVWSQWHVTQEATCTKAGKQSRVCSICGKTENLTINKLGHDAGEWTVKKEATCKSGGVMEATCTRCGTTLTEKTKKVSHDYGEWETVKEATDFSKGKRSGTCRFCGKKKTEEYYPDGTIASDLDNDADAVKELQTALTLDGYYKGELTGKYDKKTIAAVKEAEKDFGLSKDGVGWPGLKKLLGMGGTAGEGITEDPSKYSLQLYAKQISEVKASYYVGEEITYEWTLKNASTKNTTCKNAKVYHFNGKKSVNGKDELLQDIGTLKPGDSVSGTYVYKVSVEDVLSTHFTHGFIGKGVMASSKVSTNSVLFENGGGDGIGGPWTPPSEESIVITKEILNKPDNTFYFTKGETIKYRIRIENKTTDPVADVIVTDELLGSSWKKTVGLLEGKGVRVFDEDYKVTSEYLNDGEVTNTAIVSYKADETIKKSKASVKALLGQKLDAVHIFKEVTNTPANGLFFTPGETVEFKITVLNPTTTKTFTDLEIYDWLYSKTTPYQTLATLTPGNSAVYTIKVTVSYLNGKLGELINNVSVTYKDPDLKKKVSQSNECKVPCGLVGQDGVIVTKKVISTPKNGGHYELGEEIRYQIDVTNNTMKDIADLAIRDILAPMDTNGYRTVIDGETLKAGETYSIPFSYIVGPDDVFNTKVGNIASAWWSLDKVEYIETWSEPVIVPTAGKMKDEKPEQENLDGDACVPTLSGVGEGSEQRDLTECEEHTETATEAEQLTQSGDYEAAEALWDTEIKELYTEWEDTANVEIQRAAEDEEAAFTRQLDALESSLNLVCDNTETQSIVTEERMEKCVELCYELHSAPEERADSVNAEHTDLQSGTSGVTCSRAVNYSLTGAASLYDDLCESHTLTTTLTQRLLEIAEDDDDRISAWLRAQSNWLLELNTMYDTWYLSADSAEKKALIAADRIAFDELISKRRDTLSYMYPNDPAAAAEVLSNMIMHRVELICRVLHKAGVLTD